MNGNNDVLLGVVGSSASMGLMEPPGIDGSDSFAGSSSSQSWTSSTIFDALSSGGRQGANRPLSFLDAATMGQGEKDGVAVTTYKHNNPLNRVMVDSDGNKHYPHSKNVPPVKVPSEAPPAENTPAETPPVNDEPKHYGTGLYKPPKPNPTPTPVDDSDPPVNEKPDDGDSAPQKPKSHFPHFPKPHTPPVDDSNPLGDQDDEEEKPEGNNWFQAKWDWRLRGQAPWLSDPNESNQDDFASARSRYNRIKRQALERISGDIDSTLDSIDDTAVDPSSGATGRSGYGSIVGIDTKGNVITANNYNPVSADVTITRPTDGYSTKFDAERTVIVTMENGQQMLTGHDGNISANRTDPNYARDKLKIHLIAGIVLPDGEYYFTGSGLIPEDNESGHFDSGSFENVLKYQTNDESIPESTRSLINNGTYLNHPNQYKGRQGEGWKNSSYSAGCSSQRGGKPAQDTFINQLAGVSPGSVRIRIRSRHHIKRSEE